VDSFTCLDSIISKDGGSSKDIQSRIANCSFKVKNVWKNKKISVQTKTRILEATMMTVIKYGSEAWALRKADEDLLDVVQRNCSLIAVGIQLTDCISNSWLCEKCGSVPLSKAI